VDYGPLAAALLAIAGLVSVLAAVLIAVRNARSKGRRAALSEADELEGLLTACRAERLEAHRVIFELREVLTAHGIDPPA